MRMKGSCTARSVDGRSYLVYSDKFKMQHAPEDYKKPGFEERRNRVGRGVVSLD
jgi:hypothetical protein